MDETDWRLFTDCVSSSDAPGEAGCECADDNRDTNVDPADLSAIQALVGQ